MVVLGLLGGGAVAYEYAVGLRLHRGGHLLLTFITFGGAVGFLLGWYDVRRKALLVQVEANKRELERQNERLEEFASVLSHDLRNPLTVAAGRLELLEADRSTEHIGAIRRAHERINVLIDDILAMARAEQPINETATISVSHIASLGWDQVATRDATLVRDIEMDVEADATRLQRVFENLFRNAVEHGGTDVTITVAPLEDGPGFYVADDGPGISGDEFDRLFEHGYSTTDDGTGFGLAIVQRIVRAHGWTITATHSQNGGARFEITTLPGATASGERGRHEMAPMAESHA